MDFAGSGLVSRQFGIEQLTGYISFQSFVGSKNGWCKYRIIIDKAKLNHHHAAASAFAQGFGVGELIGQLLFQIGLWLCLTRSFSSRVGKSRYGRETD